MSGTDKTRGWGRLAFVAALATYALIVFGGIVRITGSGMGCGDDWPLCNGRLIPPMDFATIIEYGHRLVAILVSALVAALIVMAFRLGDRSDDVCRSLRRLSVIAGVLLLAQVLLGAVTVWLELPPASVILHLGTAMLLLAVLVAGSLLAGAAAAGRSLQVRDRAAGIGWWSAVFGFVVVFAGALVANMDAAGACQGFPLCNGRVIPGENPLTHIHWAHRVLAYGLLVWGLILPYLMRRNRPADSGLRRAAIVAALLIAAQLAVAAAMVLLALPGSLRVLHVALGAAVFWALAVVAWLSARPPESDVASDASAPSAAAVAAATAG